MTDSGEGYAHSGALACSAKPEGFCGPNTARLSYSQSQQFRWQRRLERYPLSPPEIKQTMGFQTSMDLQFRPVTVERLPDLTEFSQCHGKFRYCSCMRWRMTSAAFRRSPKQERIEALEELVRIGTPVGILAYYEEELVAWCSIAPRASYAALERSRVLPRIDDTPVWSVVCLFVDRHLDFRRQGLTCRLLQARGRLCPRTEGPRCGRLPGGAGCAVVHVHGDAGNVSPRRLRGRDACGSEAAGDALRFSF